MKLGYFEESIEELLSFHPTILIKLYSSLIFITNSSLAHWNMEEKVANRN